jgi:hypothetical protein
LREPIGRLWLVLPPQICATSLLGRELSACLLFSCSSGSCRPSVLSLTRRPALTSLKSGRILHSRGAAPLWSIVVRDSGALLVPTRRDRTVRARFPRIAIHSKGSSHSHGFESWNVNRSVRMRRQGQVDASCSPSRHPPGLVAPSSRVARATELAEARDDCCRTPASQLAATWCTGIGRSPGSEFSTAQGEFLLELANRQRMWT